MKKNHFIFAMMLAVSLFFVGCPSQVDSVLPITPVIDAAAILKSEATTDAKGLTVFTKDKIAACFTEENAAKYEVYAYIPSKVSAAKAAVELDSTKWVKVTKEEAENYTLFVVVGINGNDEPFTTDPAIRIWMDETTILKNTPSVKVYVKFLNYERTSKIFRIYFGNRTSSVDLETTEINGETVQYFEVSTSQYKEKQTVTLQFEDYVKKLKSNKLELKIVDFFGIDYSGKIEIVEDKWHEKLVHGVIDETHYFEFSKVSTYPYWRYYENDNILLSGEFKDKKVLDYYLGGTIDSESISLEADLGNKRGGFVSPKYDVVFDFTKETFKVSLPDILESIEISAENTDLKWVDFDGKYPILKTTVKLKNFTDSSVKLQFRIDGKTGLNNPSFEMNPTVSKDIEVILETTGEHEVSLWWDEKKEVRSNAIKVNIQGFKVNYEVEGVKISEDSDVAVQFAEDATEEFKNSLQSIELAKAWVDIPAIDSLILTGEDKDDWDIVGWKIKDAETLVYEKTWSKPNGSVKFKNDVTLVPFVHKKLNIVYVTEDGTEIGRNKVPYYHYLGSRDLTGEGVVAIGNPALTIEKFVKEDGSNPKTGVYMTEDLKLVARLVSKFDSLIVGKSFATSDIVNIDGVNYKDAYVVEFESLLSAKLYKVDTTTGNSYLGPETVAVKVEVKDGKDIVTFGDVEAVLADGKLTAGDIVYTEGRKPSNPHTVIKAILLKQGAAHNYFAQDEYTTTQTTTVSGVGSVTKRLKIKDYYYVDFDENNKAVFGVFERNRWKTADYVWFDYGDYVELTMTSDKDNYHGSELFGLTTIQFYFNDDGTIRWGKTIQEGKTFSRRTSKPSEGTSEELGSSTTIY